MKETRRVIDHAHCKLEPLESRQLLSAALPNIMPLGDSITESFTGHASYRYWLWNWLADAGYKANFVGTGAGVNGGSPLYAGFDADHEGHSGFRADDLGGMLETSDWKNFASQAQNKPDIVLLHIGNNDVDQGQSNVSTRNDIGKIIDDLRVINPHVTILLAEIIPGSNSSVSGLNKLLPALAKSKNTRQSHVFLVNQARGFNANADTFDGIHPNQAGEKKIASKWFAALKPLLPKPARPLAGIYLDTRAVPLTHADNAVGPVEYESSNGSDDQYDGHMLSVRGVTYMRGLGVHAPSELDFDLSGGTYTRFRAVIGVDDEVNGSGSVVFQVFVNGEASPRFESDTLTGEDAAVPINVDVHGATTLRLVVTDSGDDNSFDHADWALARVMGTTPAPQPSDVLPSAPGRLRASIRGSNVDLTWKDSSKNEFGFEVQRMIGDSGTWLPLDDVDPNANSYRDLHLGTELHYYYRVLAYNNIGESKASNVVELVVQPSAAK